MKRIFSLFALLVVFSAFSAAALADVRWESPMPKPTATPKPTEAPKETSKTGGMIIMMTDRVDEPVLVIKKEMLEKLRAAVDGTTSSAVVENSDFNRTQTIVSGLFLSLAFVFGGVWLARNRGKVSKSAAAVVVFAILGMTTTFVIGNIRAPRNVGFSRAVLSNELNVDKAYAEGKIKIVVGEGISGNDLELLFPKKDGRNEE
jgi:hypothetical protein